MEIYAVFSIDNDYNQPDNNLVALFKDKPSIEQLRDLFFEDSSIENLTDSQIMFLVDLVREKEIRFWNADYRIEKVEVRGADDIWH